MASVRSRNDKLFFDFYYQNIRCREQTLLKDTEANRIKLEKVLENIEIQIMLERFVYRDMFPNSNRYKAFKLFDDQIKANATNRADVTLQSIPNFDTVNYKWLEESKIHWKISHIKNVSMIFERYLIPEFGKFNLRARSRIESALLPEVTRQASDGVLFNEADNQKRKSNYCWSKICL
ncbi:Arm DNA-binding domain-containing protein [Pseudoalteromonas sp. ZZD1]|uniref:Arm DNA-binding domain-containing protein n=1 Tax=Pseudoalteromonas sp. ZZD1 TaxID=3139395 RepID=UPI003BAA31E0